MIEITDEEKEDWMINMRLAEFMGYDPAYWNYGTKELYGYVTGSKDEDLLPNCSYTESIDLMIPVIQKYYELNGERSIIDIIKFFMSVVSAIIDNKFSSRVFALATYQILEKGKT